MGFVTGAIAVATGLLYVAGLLLRPKPDSSQDLGKDRPPSISTRGIFIPMYRGTRKTVTTPIGWAGNRQVNEDDGGGSKKGGAGGGVTYREEVWHILGVGPASGLTQIRFNGKVRWEGNLNPATTPSGTEVSTGNVGSFTIYWGEANQPVNDFLADESRIGIRSRWPRMCYVVWDTMRYGSSPVQPQVEYVMDWRCAPAQTLESSSYSITSNAGAHDGVNPAHLVNELLTSGLFTGASLSPERVDNISLEQMGIDLSIEGLPMNVAYPDGTTVEEAMQAILQDSGYQMPEVDSRLTFQPMRYVPGASYPSLDSDDLIVSPGETRDFKFGNSISNPKPVFTFDDEKNGNYDTKDASFNDDGDTGETGLSNSQRTKMTTVTGEGVASKVARRRWQEIAADKRLSLQVLRGGRILVPGQVVTREPYGNLRVISTQWSDESPSTKVDCLVDTFGVPDIQEALDFQTPGGDENRIPLPDLAWEIVQTPSAFNSSQFPEFWLFRIRAHPGIIAAYGRTSVNGVDFLFGSTQTHGQGGNLLEAMNDTDGPIISNGPAFVPLNDDINEVLNLSGDTDGWEGGRQIGLINDEMFFIERFEIIPEDPWIGNQPVSDGDYLRPTGSVPNFRYKIELVDPMISTSTGLVEPNWPAELGDSVTLGNITYTAERFSWRPRNMIRASAGTVAGTHAIGDTFIIQDRNKLRATVHPSFDDGILARIKSQPFTDFEDELSRVPLSGIAAKSKLISFP